MQSDKVMIEAAIDALAELASAPMRLPLQDWSRISGAILAAVEVRIMPLTEAGREAVS
ncbi:hypothetical protein [Brucella intermedia]|uniref:hypothetical protein n=1 Tax=Brucella intermedia TaxID=94625 RepID=UPI00235EB8C9|nr:hypothetical protein [Brucella intermedia]